MKVFKMNECDWVVAENIVESIKWYEKEFSLDWAEDTFDIYPVECNIDKPIMYNPDIYDKPNLRLETTFRKLIKEYATIWPNQSEPYVILSTEY